MDAETLMTTPMEPLKFIVSGLLPEGLHVLAGSPKIGKAGWHCGSAYRWQRVKRCGDLKRYEASPVSVFRGQLRPYPDRLFEITDEAPSTLHFAIMSDAIGHGLKPNCFIKEHPGTGLIVIDTLQRFAKPFRKCQSLCLRL